MPDCNDDCLKVKSLSSDLTKLENKVNLIEEKQNKWITKTAVQDNELAKFNKNFDELKEDLKKIGYKTVGSILFLVLVEILALIFRSRS